LLVAQSLATPRRDWCRFSCCIPLTKLIYYEYYRNACDAIARETQLKKWSRAKKIKLINRLNPRRMDIGDQVFGE